MLGDLVVDVFVVLEPFVDIGIVDCLNTRDDLLSLRGIWVGRVALDANVGLDCARFLEGPKKVRMDVQGDMLERLAVKTGDREVDRTHPGTQDGMDFGKSSIEIRHCDIIVQPAPPRRTAETDFARCRADSCGTTDRPFDLSQSRTPSP